MVNTSKQDKLKGHLVHGSTADIDTVHTVKEQKVHGALVHGSSADIDSVHTVTETRTGALVHGAQEVAEPEEDQTSHNE